MDFLYPVKVGELIIISASVNHVFGTSLEVGVKVEVGFGIEVEVGALVGVSVGIDVLVGVIVSVGVFVGGRIVVVPDELFRYDANGI